MGLSSAYSGPGGQQVREQQGGYDYNPPAVSGGSSSSSSTMDIFKELFSALGAVSGNPLFGLGLNLFGNLFTNSQNRRSIEQTNRLNMQMQQNQNAWNERMWHMNNEYNTPANQLKRLKEAGLNPDLMYGNPSQGTSASPAQGTTPSHAEAFQSLGFGDMFSNAQQLMMQKKANDAQIKLMNSQAEQMEVETQLKKKDLGTYDKRFELVKQAADDASKKIMSDIQVNQQSINESVARVNEIAAREKLTLEQAATEVVNRAFLEESFQERLEQIRLQNNLTRAQANQLIAATKLLLEQVVTEQAKQANIQADTNYKNAQIISIGIQDNLSVTKLASMIEDQFSGFVTVNSDGTYSKTFGDAFGSDFVLTVRSAFNYVGSLISGLLPFLGRRR